MVASLPAKAKALFLDDFTTTNISWQGFASETGKQAFPAFGSFTDGSANVWTVTAGFGVKENGISVLADGSGVSAAYLVGSTIWVVTYDDRWFFWTGSTWTQSTQPIGFGWLDHYPFGGNEYFLPAVDEREYMCDMLAGGQVSSTGFNPFSVSGSVLTIKAQSVTGSGISNPASQAWNGGNLTSCIENSGSPVTGLYDFQYGYVEILCQTPTGGPTNLGGPGAWPQFVLYPLSGVGPVELDIFEILGGSPNIVRQTVHDSLGGTTFFQSTVAINTGFHRVGVDWQSDFITFYIDGVKTNQMATPSGFNQRFYINCGLAIAGSGSWVGTPANAVLTDPCFFLIDYIGVWANYVSAYPPSTATTPASLFLWEGAGAYGVGASSILTTQLNSLTSSSANVLSSASAAITTNSRIFCDLEFVAGGAITTVAPSVIEVWFLRSLDGGSNYEDGSSSVAPLRPADAIIPVRQGSGITPRAGTSKVVLPPGTFKVIVRNQVTTLPASGNLLRMAAYSFGY